MLGVVANGQPGSAPLSGKFAGLVQAQLGQSSLQRLSYWPGDSEAWHISKVVSLQGEGNSDNSGDMPEAQRPNSDVN